MTRIVRFGLSLIVVLLAGNVVTAQVATGTPAFGSFGGGPFDTVNLGNLNTHFSVPILHKAGRGKPFNYDLDYESSIWKPVGISGSQTWQPSLNWGWLPNWSGGTAGYMNYSTTYADCYIPEVQVWVYGGVQTDSGFVYRDPWGSSHAFPGAYSSYSQCTATTSSNLPFAANDGSGLTLTTYYQIKTASGEVFTPPYNTGSAQATTITDANGNQITSNTGGTFTDTLGTTALTVTGSGTPSSPVLLTYTSPTGSPHVTVNYTFYNIKTNFNCSGISLYTASNVPLVSSIVMPDNSQYTFQYETTLGAGNSGYKTGRLLSVTLPTGGTIMYAYSGGSGDADHNAINCSDGSVPTLARTLNPGGQWTYARTQTSGNHWKTIVTTPPDPTVGNDTVIDFAKDSATTNPTNNFYETQRLSYQGSSTSGTLLSTAITCYNGNSIATPANCLTTAVSTPISRTTAFRYLPDANGLQAKTDSYFDTYGLVSSVFEYDYGSATPLRTTAISYYGGLGNGIVDHPYQVTTYDGNSNITAQTTYLYDQATPTAISGTPQHIAISGSRGNLTTVTSGVTGSGGPTLSKGFTYYDTGTLKTSVDVNGAVTIYNYDNSGTPPKACGNSFVTSVSMPLSLSSSTTWDCNGGVATSSKDANDKTTTITYNDPNFWRPASVQDPLSNTANFTYTAPVGSTPASVRSKMQFNSNNSVVESLSTLDTMGRPYLSQQREGPASSNYDSQQVNFNNFGRPYQATMPFVQAAGQGSSTAPKTTTTYDALGRVLQTTDAASGYVSYTYNKNDVLQVMGPAPSGENTKQKQFEYDALGRLTSVCEVTNLAGSGVCGQTTTKNGYWTKYAYDTAIINNLVYNRTTVTQNAQSGTPQTRTYLYDQLGRLVSETNPENGTTQYFYDGDSVVVGPACSTVVGANWHPPYSGDLTKKYDAKGNTICQTYDAMHRVTGTYYAGPDSGNTPVKTFVYDSATFNGTAMSNPKGRLVEAYTGASGSKTTDEFFSYSARGELTDVWECTPHSGTNGCASVSNYYRVTAAYWATGALSSLSSNISGLPSQTYSVDPMGRTSAVTASSGQNPVTGTNYNLSAFTSSVTFGSGDSDTFYQDSNTGRQTKYVFNVNGATNTGQTNWNQNGSLGSLQITDNIAATSDTQTCNYTHDDLSRVANANCANGATAKWNQSFSYDAFGNITKNTSGPGISFNPLYSATTNWITSLPGITPTTDANGRMTYDGTHNYAWDADSKMVGVDTITITYDAQGRMVEKNVSGVYTQIVYGPQGRFAAMNGQTLVKAFVPLPAGATAVYTSTSLGTSNKIAYYRHSDHLGSSRLATTPTRTLYSSTAYAPYGEPYAQAGTTDVSFTGQEQDTVSGMYDFLMRKNSPVQGRWLSPDPAGLAAVSFSNPQTWNRYGYVGNSPLNATDPLGLVTNPNPPPTPPSPPPPWPSPPDDPGAWGGCDWTGVVLGTCGSSRAAEEAFRQAIANGGWEAAMPKFPDQLPRIPQKGFCSFSASGVPQDSQATVQQVFNQAGVYVDFVSGSANVTGTAAATWPGWNRGVIGHNFGDVFGNGHDLFVFSPLYGYGATQSQIGIANGLNIGHEIGHYMTGCGHGGSNDCGATGIMKPVQPADIRTWNPNDAAFQFTDPQQKTAIQNNCQQLQQNGHL